MLGRIKYFDFANHVNVRIIASIYFEQGYPFEPHLSAILSDLDDLRVMRNACAHKASSTQKSLENLALRVFGAPRVSITIYEFVTAVDPRAAPGETVFLTYKNKLLATAELIANG